jgi:hypothetical protein
MREAKRGGDETFDIGVDTRTSVNEKDYQVPFAFNGKIDTLDRQPRADATDRRGPEEGGSSGRQSQRLTEGR